ncbi:MAG: hypothetical protein CVU99_15945 [Firmicutes bacterium HGW-Firmicutes-4]|jgi:hypothetical protein|nr:MAG: hypothetical protein CVU99_15945 [Firmicutes bacterium HGW-Firmicutes-4]
MTVKLCENCINDVKTSQEQPCLDCRKGSGWESKSAGCDFCKGIEEKKIGYIEISCFEFRDKKHLTVVVYEDESGLEAIDEESFDINYCPMCGRKLKGDNNV